MRLFVGIPVPRYAKTALRPLMRDEHPGLSWVPEANLHLTLKFIGDVDPPAVRQIADRLFDVHVRPFILQIEGVGAFPPPPKKRPHVLWVGLGSAHPHLFQLQKQIDQTLAPIGIDPDLRVYSPHITLARCKQSAHEAIRQWLKAHREFETAPFEVTFFTLYESRPALPGRQYFPVQTYSLA